MIPDQIHIRVASADDVPALWQLFSSILPKDSASIHENTDEFTTILSGLVKNPTVFIYVATVLNNIIGVILASIKKKKLVFGSERIGVIEWLYLSESYRGEALSKKLVNKVLIQFRLNKIDFAEARLYNDVDKALWQNLGFSQHMLTLRKDIS